MTWNTNNLMYVFQFHKETEHAWPLKLLQGLILEPRALAPLWSASLLKRMPAAAPLLNGDFDSLCVLSALLSAAIKDDGNGKAFTLKTCTLFAIPAALFSSSHSPLSSLAPSHPHSNLLPPPPPPPPPSLPIIYAPAPNPPSVLP